MANSRGAGPLGGGNARVPDGRTPGPLGHNDQGDPSTCSLLGDSPGPLGLFDWGDPTLPLVRWGERFPPGGLGRSLSGRAGEGATQGAITKAQLKLIFPRAQDDFLAQVAAELNTDLAAYGLDTVLRKAHFFAQVRQESGPGFNAAVESLNYRPEALKATFKYYRTHPDEAEADGNQRTPKAKAKVVQHGASQETIANKVYGGRNGNGDIASGDGWSFRGRGLIQVTGRANYAAATQQYQKIYKGSSVDFEVTPNLMAEFPYTVRSAVCFWIKHGLHKLADRGSSGADVDRITKVINRATDSYGERRTNFTGAHNAFK